jgi:para-nitrobenzyl esterase
MSGLWAAFARNGRPSAPDVAPWPAYDLARRATMYIDAPCHVEEDPQPATRRFWQARPEGGDISDLPDKP